MKLFTLLCTSALLTAAFAADPASNNSTGAAAPLQPVSAKAIAAQKEALGINYLIAYMMFGTMTLPDALRSLALFRSEVMPAVEKM